MAKKNFSLQDKKKKELGKLIRDLRESREISLRSLADAVGLSPSNLSYIEKGVNAPTGEVYLKIIENINPGKKAYQKMDELYMAIRNLPPPDICELLMKNPELIEQIRKNI
jgi:transcriptional regulator with XRE-family HTH domain